MNCKQTSIELFLTLAACERIMPVIALGEGDAENRTQFKMTHIMASRVLQRCLSGLPKLRDGRCGSCGCVNTTKRAL